MPNMRSFAGKIAVAVCAFSIIIWMIFSIVKSMPDFAAVLLITGIGIIGMVGVTLVSVGLTRH